MASMILVIGKEDALVENKLSSVWVTFGPLKKCTVILKKRH